MGYSHYVDTKACFCNMSVFYELYLLTQDISFHLFRQDNSGNNTANLRDLTAATGLTVLPKFDSNSARVKLNFDG